MAGEDRPCRLARRGKARRGADRLHVRADHALRIGLARPRLEPRVIDDIPAVSGQA